MQQGIYFQEYDIQETQSKLHRKSRALKKKQRIEKLEKLYQDPEHKKVERQKKKKREKQKLAKQTKGMNQLEINQYLKKKNQDKKLLKQKLIASKTNGLPILIDLVYEQHMNDKERKSLAIQIELITKAMRRLQYPCSLHLCNVGNTIQQSLKRMRYQYWHLTPHQENFVEVGKMLNKQLIYLSPDAQEQLEDVSYDHAYVIGGLVDRTILKNASLNRANEWNIKTKKLPIDKLMVNRKCLNLDHVAMILCKFLQNKNWKESFQYGAPKRFKKQQQDQQNQQKQESQGSSQNLEQIQEIKEIRNQVQKLSV